MEDWNIVGLISTSYNFIGIDQKRRDSLSKRDLDFKYWRILRHKWFFVTLIQAEHNSESSLNLRASLGLIAGYRFRNTNSTNLYAADGMKENYEESRNNTTFNGETLETLGFNLFRHDSPKMDK